MDYLIDNGNSGDSKYPYVFIVGGNEVSDTDASVEVVNKIIQELKDRGLTAIISNMKGYDMLIRDSCREIGIDHSVFSSMSLNFDRRESLYYKYRLMRTSQRLSNFLPIVITDNLNEIEAFSWEMVRISHISPLGFTKEGVLAKTRGGRISRRGASVKKSTSRSSIADNEWDGLIISQNKIQDILEELHRSRKNNTFEG